MEMNSAKRSRPVVIGCLLIGLLGACAAPIGVHRVDPRSVQRSLAESVLTSDPVSYTHLTLPTTPYV